MLDLETGMTICFWLGAPVMTKRNPNLCVTFTLAIVTVMPFRLPQPVIFGLKPILCTSLLHLQWTPLLADEDEAHQPETCMCSRSVGHLRGEWTLEGELIHDAAPSWSHTGSCSQGPLHTFYHRSISPSSYTGGGRPLRVRGQGLRGVIGLFIVFLPRMKASEFACVCVCWRFFLCVWICTLITVNDQRKDDVKIVWFYVCRVWHWPFYMQCLKISSKISIINTDYLPLVTLYLDTAVVVFLQSHTEGGAGLAADLVRGGVCGCAGLTLRREPLKGLWRECNIKSRIIPQSLLSFPLLLLSLELTLITFSPTPRII